MSEALRSTTLDRIEFVKTTIDDVVIKADQLIELLGKEVGWDEMSEQDISKYNDRIDALRYSVETLMGKTPVRVHRCKNCGNIFFSDGKFDCCRVWSPDGRLCCTTAEMPEPYGTWKCPPRRIEPNDDKQEE